MRDIEEQEKQDAKKGNSLAVDHAMVWQARVDAGLSASAHMPGVSAVDEQEPLVEATMGAAPKEGSAEEDLFPEDDYEIDDLGLGFSLDNE
eukprot:1730813-Karenia_brevis.AAC.1